MRYKIQSMSDIGRVRKSNQDFLGYTTNNEGCLFAIVCDGMGGHAHGELASKMAVETFIRLFEKETFLEKDDNQINQWLRDSVKQIVQEMKDHVDVFYETHDMGTTLTAVLFVEKKAFVVNIGDSRTYRLKDGKLNQITVDQNLWNDKDNREKRKEEIKNYLGAKFNEMTYWKVLTSALGPNKNTKIDTYLLNDNVGTFVLTTDGVHDYIDAETFTEILSSKRRLKSKAKDIIEFAMNNFSTDNLSLLIVEMMGE
ncbi:serine/threonine phosphatase [Mesoplasma florum L1]|uniref:Serine/threonine phosphatase n=2 Tax=Mesoplasma florum TaxID=2151 RepID=Q6F1P6_MESFL|nr:protein phosphatase 2C domain-containing protein [Mesoplasma florum]AAT75577.1 serine/threonine phosphatase [Mesoplasma florum L1]AGY41293.1 Protein serine threonine phosphatase PrpC, regulation of stationary phase [Mesoplasma florum W37]ATI73175.1 serine/threonine-protein phosphatase [Mesoplasma florum]ATI73862.1 serine/threonine-protein phosphatase [Mesoplasma florum]AVN58828.1 serine/threonine-protein phosphatase [Mesoplasma florum]